MPQSKESTLGLDNITMIHSPSDLAKMVQKYGFLPLLRNHIPGFSVEDYTPPELWFTELDGPWEWKGPVIQMTGCAYGKFFHGKAGFISAEWFPDFANYRRDGYDFDARYEDGLARYQDKQVYDILLEYHSLISKEWRRLAGISKRSEFDSIVSGLQMQGYVTTVDFEYTKSRNGKIYGWGLARYATPETFFGKAFTDHVYERSPEQSREKIVAHLKKILPQADAKSIDRLVG